MTYDPQKEDGAKCDVCFLQKHRVGGPVPSEINAGAIAVVVGEGPDERECEIGKPLVGSAGQELDISLSSQAIKRGDLSYVNALSCRSQGNDISLMLHRLQRENRSREKLNKELPEGERLPLWESPIACCKPRLLKEILLYENVITLGKIGTAVVLGEVSIMDVRGGPANAFIKPDGTTVWQVDDGREFPRIEGAKRLKVLPTLHPRLVQRQRRWTRAFRADLGRAIRWFKGKRQWTDPEMITAPSPAKLREYFDSGDCFIFDVETSIEVTPMLARLKCIGFCCGRRAVLVPFESQDGIEYYTEHEKEEVKDICRALFTNPTKIKIGHNAGYYDTIVIKYSLGVTPAPLIDTILYHRGAEPELPHSLAYAGSVYTDVGSWKFQNTATESRNDAELFSYCMRDCSVTEDITQTLVEACKLRGVTRAVEVHHKIQQVCVGMHENGMFVDQNMRRRLEYIERTKVLKYAKLVREYAEDEKLNPNSVPQIGELLFEKWKLPVPMPPSGASRAELSAAKKKFYTKLGEPSTSDEMLRALDAQNKLSKQQSKLINSLRLFRRASKRLGTYILKARPFVEEVPYDYLATDEEEEDELNFSSKKGKKKKKTGLALADGRIHADYNSHSVKTARLSSSHMNMQNIGKDLRNMFRAAPGHVLVGADADQLELRTIADLSNCARYLEAFRDKRDPHSETAGIIFGKKFTDLPSYKTNKLANEMRQLGKVIQYAGQYWADLPKICDIIRSAENIKTGELMYKNLSQREIGKMYDAWLGGAPEIPIWWEETVQEYRSQGFLREPVCGWRLDFLDGEDRNELVAFKPQSSGAHVVHLATIDLIDAIPFQKWGPGTGLVAQVHDALVVECPCTCGGWDAVTECVRHDKTCTAVDVAHTLEACMNRKVPGMDVEFTAKAEISRFWNRL